MISDPLRLLDCSLESDGGAAVVISAADRARDLRQPPVMVMGVAEGHPDSPSAITQRPDLTTLGPGQGGAEGLRHGRRDARRHRRGRDLRLLHLHRAVPARGCSASARRARAAPSSQDGAIRLGRQAAGQHAWRAAVAGAHGRNEPHRRTDAPVARRGGRHRCATRRSAWSPATATWATARSPSCGGRDDVGLRQAAAAADRRHAALLGRAATARRLRLQRCADCGKVRHYPRPVCDAC